MSRHLFKRTIARCGQEVSVRKRELGPTPFGSNQPVISFTEIATPEALTITIESVRGGSKKFSGVQIDSSATHLFCMEYTAALSAVERDNYYIFLGNKNFRVLAVTDINEKNSVLAIQATDRGESTKEATKS